MLPLLKRAGSKAIRVPEVENQIADQFGLTQAERDQLLPSGRQKVLHNRLHWAKFYLSKAGLAASTEQRRFIASDEGKVLLSKNPPQIDTACCCNIQASKNSIMVAQAQPLKHQMVHRQPRRQHSPHQLRLKSKSRRRIWQYNRHLERNCCKGFQNSPNFFEQVIIDLLVKMGYGGSHRNAAAQLGGTGDGGVDGIINEDRLGLDRVYIQAKRYKDGSIRRPDVQAFVGSLVGLGATKGIFVTTSTFSKQAIQFARHLTQRVILIDGPRLSDLMIEHDVGVRVSRAIQFKRIDEDFFSEEE